MGRKIFVWVTFFLLIVSYNFTYGQISDNSIPKSFDIDTKSSQILPFRLLDSIKIEERTIEDQRLGIPNRFGIAQDVNIDIRKEGLETGSVDTRIWRYEIKSPDAVALSVNFSIYDLPEGAKVFIYSPDKQKIRGGYTNKINDNGTELRLAEFQGNALVIEYNEPLGAEFPGELKVGYVSSSYTELQSVANSWIPINCQEGEDWQEEKRSVCLISYIEYPNAYYCTGALVNNVREDQTPYFLTANHCISSNTVASTLIAYFNYENSTCYSYDARKEQTLSGAGLKSTSSYTDFTLLKLSENPPKDYSPYFAGWDASTDLPSKGTSIHHPEGSYKCIALDYDAPAVYSSAITWDRNYRSNPNTHWEVKYDTGTDEPGSSGCPLFDENKRIIGQLHGGDEISSFFGRFSLSWNYYSQISSSHLKTWLDPDNKGILKLDGIDFNSTPKARFSADVSIACLGSTVYLTDESKYLPSEWLWQIEPGSVEFVNGTNMNSQNPEFIFTEEGLYNIVLIAGNSNGSDTIKYNSLIQAVANLDVNFIGFPDEVTICGHELQDYLLIGEGADEFSFAINDEHKFDYFSSSDSLVLTLKDEFRKYGPFDTYIKVTGTHGSCTSSDSILFHIIIPENDDVQTAINLKPGRNAFFSNKCGTVENNEPFPLTTDCYLDNNWCPASSSTVLDNTIWFTFKGNSSGTISIGTEGFDTQIAVYEADSYVDILTGDFKMLAANDNYSNSTSSLIENIEVEFGKTYWLQVDGNGGDFGDLSINLLSNSIEVYPNPSNGKFNLTISTKDEGKVEVEVYSISGQRIYHDFRNFNYDSNTATMDLSGNPSGMYFLRASINGMQMSRKLILAH